MAYKGTVNVIDGLVPKNNGTFAIVNAHDVYVDDENRLDAKLNGIEADVQQVVTEEIATIKNSLGGPNFPQLTADKIKVNNELMLDEVLEGIDEIEQASVRVDIDQNFPDIQKARARNNIGAVELAADLTETGKAADSKVVGDEITELKDDLNSLFFTGENKFNPSDTKDNSTFDSQGNVVDDSGTWTSGNVIVPSGATHIIVSFLATTGTKTVITSGSARIAFYKATGYDSVSANMNVDLPPDITYIRIKLPDSFSKQIVMIEFNTIMTPDFVPYEHAINPDLITVDTSLLMPGVPADAKTVGDSIREIESVNDSIVGQINELNENLDGLIIQSSNKFNPNTIIPDSALNGNGDVISSPGKALTEFIAIPSDATHLIVSYLSSSGQNTLITSTSLRIYWFESKESAPTITTLGDCDIETGATFIRVGYASTTFSDPTIIMVEFANSLNPSFVYYSKTIEPTKIKLDGTLTNSELPAQAAAVGNLINSNDEKYSKILNSIYSVSENNNANLLNPFTVKKNIALDASTGAESPSTGACVSDWITLPENATTATGLYMATDGTITIPNAAGRIDVFYFADKSADTFISPRQYGQHSIPESARYCRVSCATSYARVVWNVMYGIGTLNQYMAYDHNVEAESVINPNKFSLIDYLVTHPTTQIKLIGDSITHGVGGTGFAQDGDTIFSVDGGTSWSVNTSGHCWANMFKDHLMNLFPQCTVKNWGCRGISTMDVWAYNMLPTIVEDNDDVVIIMLGTNDRTESRYVSADDAKHKYKLNLKGIVEYIRNRGKKVLILSSIPATPNGDIESNVLVKSNIINSIANSACTQVSVPYYNVYGKIVEWVLATNTAYSTLFSDILHPNDNGYNLIFFIVCQLLGVPNDLTFTLT